MKLIERALAEKIACLKIQMFLFILQIVLGKKIILDLNAKKNSVKQKIAQQKQINADEHQKVIRREQEMNRKLAIIQHKLNHQEVKNWISRITDCLRDSENFIRDSEDSILKNENLIRDIEILIRFNEYKIRMLKKSICDGENRISLLVKQNIFSKF